MYILNQHIDQETPTRHINYDGASGTPERLLISRVEET